MDPKMLYQAIVLAVVITAISATSFCEQLCNQQLQSTIEARVLAACNCPSLPHITAGDRLFFVNPGGDAGGLFGGNGGQGGLQLCTYPSFITAPGQSAGAGQQLTNYYCQTNNGQCGVWTFNPFPTAAGTNGGTNVGINGLGNGGANLGTNIANFILGNGGYQCVYPSGLTPPGQANGLPFSIVLPQPGSTSSGVQLGNSYCQVVNGVNGVWTFNPLPNCGGIGGPNGGQQPGIFNTLTQTDLTNAGVNQGIVNAFLQQSLINALKKQSPPGCCPNCAVRCY